jgi:hypothetical protein
MDKPCFKLSILALAVLQDAALSAFLVKRSSLKLKIQGKRVYQVLVLVLEVLLAPGHVVRNILASTLQNIASLSLQATKLERFDWQVFFSLI